MQYRHDGHSKRNCLEISCIAWKIVCRRGRRSRLTNCYALGSREVIVMQLLNKQSVSTQCPPLPSAPPAYTRRRVKQVRFGKLAFPQLNGAFFQPRMPVFGHFALCFQGKNPSNWHSGLETVHIFTALGAGFWDTSSCPKP